MDREKLERTIAANSCIEGGTREACIKIREVLNHKMNPGNQLHAPGSSVTIEEFIQAVEVLVTYAAEREDEKVQLYRCDSDCAYIYCLYCPGRLAASENGTVWCPHYVTEDK